MVDGIQNGGGGRAALEAALERMRAKSSGLQPSAAPTEGTASFGEAMKAGLQSVDEKLTRTEGIHLEVLQGKLDIHEVASQLKSSELSFQFALQVRNKLIDAYREVMRMSV